MAFALLDDDLPPRSNRTMNVVRRRGLPYRVADLDPSMAQKAVAVMVVTEWYVNGEAYFAMTASPAMDPDNLSILTRREYNVVDSGLEQLVRHEESLWSCVGGQRPPLPVGYSAFLLVLFSSIVFLENVAHDMGASVSFSDNQTHEARSGEDRDRLYDQKEKDAPWIVVYRFPQRRLASLEHLTKSSMLRTA